MQSKTIYLSTYFKNVIILKTVEAYIKIQKIGFLTIYNLNIKSNVGIYNAYQIRITTDYA